MRAGYRHIDTAHAYNDEKGVGRAVKTFMAESGTPREQIWITSKIWPTEYGEGKTLKAIDEMLERLQLDYVDLLYVHQPVGDFVGAWRDMEKAVATGKVRALGLSNFDASDEVFERIMSESTVKPAVLPDRVSSLRATVGRTREGKSLTASTLPAGSRWAVRCRTVCCLKDPTIMKIAEAHGKTPAQVILRWHMQEGFSAIPGASNPDYIKENIAIFDFELTDGEMAQMRSLDKEKRFFNMTLEEKERAYLGEMRIPTQR